MRCVFYMQIVTLALFVSGCGATNVTKDGVRDTELTVGLVQREVGIGMGASDVAEVLGSPNIVTKDASGGETWIYDKFSSEQLTRSFGGALAIFGGNTAGAVTGSERQSKTLSKTLTVILKFDSDNKIKSVAYHRSKY